MPSTTLRQETLAQAKRVVIKLGTQLLTGAAGEPDASVLKHVAEQVAKLIEDGVDVTMVSSGAIGVGCQALELSRRPRDIGVQQAVAAVGQSGLMSCWRQAFRPHDITVAQMLLTRDDFEDRTRYLNIRNCISELHKLQVVPVINENDTVSVDEIRLGDNDILAAMVTNALRADALINLTVVSGLTDSKGQVLDIVDDVAEVRALAMKTKTKKGTGGMQTKLEAARMVTDAGEIAVIADGRAAHVLTDLMSGKKIGTVFVPAARKLDSRQRWIVMAARPAGALAVDDGAAKAVTDRGKSLLASGVVSITGVFAKGDVVLVRDGRGREIARGLINYRAEEARAIMGKRSSQFEKLLGHCAYEELIHRDNLVTVATR